jgi:hypothetical protein
MKHLQNCRRTRYCVLDKNRYHATFQGTAYNFREMVFFLKKQAKQVLTRMTKVIEIEARANCAKMV